MAIISILEKSLQKGTILNPVETFLSDLEVSGKSAHTVTSYKHDLNQFRRFYTGDILKTSTELLRSYFVHLKKGRLSPATIGRKQAALTSFFSWCFKNDLIGANPMEKIDRVKIPQKKPRPIDEITLRKLFEAIPGENTRDLLLFRLMLDTGMRIAEALGVYVEHLILVPGDEKIIILAENAKGAKERIVPLYGAPDALELLARHLDETGYKHGPLFRGTGDGPMHYRTAHEIFRRLCAKAGVKLTIHALRHTFATDLLNDDVDVSVVSSLMGHAHISTTMRYSAVGERLIKEALAKRRNRLKP